MSGTYLKITDFTKAFKESIALLTIKETLVGIPRDESQREEGQITNAELLFINEFGSPVNNIPARPVMSIGIRKVRDEIVDEFKACAKAILDKDSSALERYYERVGIIASNSVKNVINNQEGIEHIAFSTALARLRAGFNGDKALVVTGQMRNAITYVVRNK